MGVPAITAEKLPPMSLTDIAIKNAKPREKPYKVSDEKGMYLEVRPNDSYWWRLKYRFGGKEKLLSLGTYPEVTLKEARWKCDAARLLLREGKDPSAERKAEKRTQRLHSQNAFELVAREYIEKYANRWGKSHRHYVQRRLEANIFPDLGNRALAEIEAPELLDVIRKMEARGAHDLAHRVMQVCSQVFRYGIATGRCARDPAADLRGALTPHKKRHMAVVRAEDYPQLLASIEAYEGDLQTRLALKMLALTFVRTQELIGAEWQEFDFEAAMWVLPADRMKMKAEHLVPLSRQALAVLEDLRRINGESRYVFAGINPRKPMSNNTMLYALYRMGYRSRMTGHGFRSVASTILNEISGFRSDVIERQLAHCERNAVRGAYNRAEYLPERRKMMQWWADYLDKLRGGNVIPARFGLAAG